LDQISREACLSRYHFLRLFREEFQTTPHQYLIDRRIEKAKELLRHRRLTVTDVCFEVGFQSLGSFSTCIRERVVSRPSIIEATARSQSKSDLFSQHVRPWGERLEAASVVALKIELSW
jgi:AraC-like DNA-binding protein